MIEWRDIVREHGGVVWRTVVRFVGNEADAADCFQETFLCAMEQVKGREVRNWAGFLQRVATGRGLDMLRRRAVNKRRLGGRESELVAGGGRGPAEEVENLELGERLARALAQLPGEQGEMYCLRHLNGMSYEEIAGELRITVEAVGTGLHRTRGRLREMLGEACVNEMNRGGL